MISWKANDHDQQNTEELKLWGCRGHLCVFRHSLINSTSAIKQRAADGTPATSSFPLLWSKSRCNLQENKLRSHHIVFLVASCNTCNQPPPPKKKKLPVMAASVQSFQPGAENSIHQLMVAGRQICLLFLSAVPLFHVILIHAECCNSVKVKNKSKPPKC